MKFASFGVSLHLQLTGYSVTAARVLWEDLVSVQIRVPRLEKPAGLVEQSNVTLPR
jgi:hypothetical protein